MFGNTRTESDHHLIGHMAAPRGRGTTEQGDEQQWEHVRQNQPRGGFEPPACGLRNRRSNQLSYPGNIDSLYQVLVLAFFKSFKAISPAPRMARPIPATW